VTRQTYHRHLVDDVLAWWAANGPDDEHGGVLTCWDNAGTRLVATDKYTWSQGRWAWLTARVAGAAERGLLDLDSDRDAGWYAEQATRTARFVRDHALLPDGTTAFVTSRAGEPREPTPGAGLHTSVFADLFAALGFAGVAQLYPNGDWGGYAEAMLLRSAAAIDSGRFRSDPYPVPAGHRSFGLPMILVGVGEQVHRATGSAASADVVHHAARQIEQYHLDGDDVAEMPSATDGLLARHRTPGHVLEAAWFLHHARDLLAGSPLAAPERLARIAVRALDLGGDDVHGGLFRYVDRAGGAPTGARTDDPYEALVVDTWDTKLWWPHAEALYATALLAPDRHARLHDYVFGTFPEGPGREWTQIRTRHGAPLEKTVALPVKDPFHIARALLMLVELEGEG
jgi:N-acylglucosamine 2-epimerase